MCGSLGVAAGGAAVCLERAAFLEGAEVDPEVDAAADACRVLRRMCMCIRGRGVGRAGAGLAGCRARVYSSLIKYLLFLITVARGICVISEIDIALIPIDEPTFSIIFEEVAK